MIHLAASPAPHPNLVQREKLSNVAKQFPSGQKYCYQTMTPPPTDRDQCAVTTDCPKNWQCMALGGKRGSLKNCVRGTPVMPAKCRCAIPTDNFCFVTRPLDCLKILIGSGRNLTEVGYGISLGFVRGSRSHKCSDPICSSVNENVVKRIQLTLPSSNATTKTSKMILAT